MSLSRHPLNAARAAAGSAACALLLAFALAASAPGMAADLVVIVSARSAVTALSAEQVAELFLSGVTHYPDGGDAVALDQRVGSPVRDAFYVRVASCSPERMKAYWTQRLFMGRGRPPRELHGNADVRRDVAANPALIGYIERRALNPSVRSVLVLQ